MRYLFLLLFLAGLVHDFGYPAAIEAISGRVITAQALFAGEGDFQAADIALEAGQAPVRIDVEIQMAGADTAAVPEYGGLELHVSRSGQPVLDSSLDVRAFDRETDSSGRSAALLHAVAGTIDPVTSGAYHFEAEGRGEVTNGVSQIGIILRANALEVDRRALVGRQRIAGRRLAEGVGEHPQEAIVDVRPRVPALARLADPRDPLVDVERAQLGDLGPVDDHVAIGAVDPVDAGAVLAGGELGPRRDPHGVDPPRRPQHEVHLIGPRRLVLHPQDVGEEEVEVAPGERAHVLLGDADEAEEGQQQGEVRPTEARRLGGADRRRIVHVGDDAIEVDVVADEPAPVELRERQRRVGEAQRLAQAADELEPVLRAPLVDRDVAGIERLEGSRRLARAVADAVLRVGEGHRRGVAGAPTGSAASPR